MKKQYKTYLNMRLEVVRENPVKYVQFKTPDDVFNELKAEYLKSPKEIIKCIHLNTKNYIIGIETIGIGSVDRCYSTIGDVFKGALIANASAIVVTHNHPAGDPAPSREDKRFTLRLSEAGKLLQIKVLDHIIFGDKNYYSFNSESAL